MPGRQDRAVCTTCVRGWRTRMPTPCSPGCTRCPTRLPRARPGDAGSCSRSAAPSPERDTTSATTSPGEPGAPSGAPLRKGERARGPGRRKEIPVALHRLTTITIGVPDVASTAAYYEEFGLRPTADAGFATVDGGEQLRH